MKLNSLLSLAAAIFALAGCSSTPTKVDSGAIHGATFSFVVPGPRVLPNYADKSTAVNNAIQNAITEHLTGRGLSKLDTGGDIIVGYMLVVGNNANTTSINEYFGYRDDIEGLEKKAHEAHNASKSPNYFEAGTLVIDLIDGKSYKLLKRGYASRALLQNPTPEARAARIREVVAEILGSAQIGH